MWNRASTGRSSNSASAWRTRPAPRVEAAPTPTPAVLSGTGWPIWAEAVDAFLDFVKANNRDGSYEWYVDKLGAFRERYGTRPTAGPGSLTDEYGTRYKLWLRTEKTWKKGKRLMRGLSDTTVGMHMRAARRLLRWAAKEVRRDKYGVQFNPWQDQQIPKGKERERILTDAEFEALLRRCAKRREGQDFRELLILLRKTTLRPGELRKLRWENIRWDEHRIVILKDDVKTKVRRYVSLVHQAEQVLLERKARIEAETKRPVSGYVFPGGRGRVKDSSVCMKKGTLSQAFRKLVNRCVAEGEIEAEKEGERIVPYTTRHTRTTEMVTEGNDKEIIRQEAGHRFGTTTEKYIHLANSLTVTESIKRNDRGAASSSGSGASAATPGAAAPVQQGTEPAGRPAAAAFLDEARRRGWRVETTTRDVVQLHHLQLD